MDITIERISNELKTQNKKQQDLTEFLGIGHSTFANWKAGLNKSYLKYLHAIADFLDVSVEYLKGETDEKKKPSADNDEELTNEKRLLLALFDQIPKEKQAEAIKRFLEVLNNP
jgi:transcriptional regulator with XRE-family HTH domain